MALACHDPSVCLQEQSGVVGLGPGEAGPALNGRWAPVRDPGGAPWTPTGQEVLVTCSGTQS